MIRAGYFQFDPVFGDKKQNLLRVAEAVEKFHDELDILVLPELFTTGYHFSSKQQVEEWAEFPEGETYQTLKKIASERNCYLFGGFIEKSEKGCYNSSILVFPNGEYRIYRKAHLFFEETLYFIKSDSLLEPIEITIRGKKIKAGLMICFDWFFPETARALALKGAQILLHTANLVLPYCPAATITRALENKVFIILCNRVGKETAKGKELSFIGLSRIVSPKGEILSESGKDNEEIQTAFFDPFDADNKSINIYNNLFEDRRTDLYRI